MDKAAAKKTQSQIKAAVGMLGNLLISWRGDIEEVGALLSAMASIRRQFDAVSRMETLVALVLF